MRNNAAIDARCILCCFRAIVLLLLAFCVFCVLLQGSCWLSVFSCWVFFGMEGFLQLKVASENTESTIGSEEERVFQWFVCPFDVSALGRS